MLKGTFWQERRASTKFKVLDYLSEAHTKSPKPMLRNRVDLATRVQYRTRGSWSFHFDWKRFISASGYALMVAIRAMIRAAIRAIGAKSEASFAFSAHQLLFSVPLSLKILGYIFMDFVFLLYVQLTFVSFTNSISHYRWYLRYRTPLFESAKQSGLYFLPYQYSHVVPDQGSWTVRRPKKSLLLIGRCQKYWRQQRARIVGLHLCLRFQRKPMPAFKLLHNGEWDPKRGQDKQRQ